jgi:hypothetical protein
MVSDRAAVDPVEVRQLWNSPEKLIVHAIVDHGREVVWFPDTGCMRRDLAGHLAARSTVLHPRSVPVRHVWRLSLP